MEFGEKLKKLRTENGLHQEEVAKKIGVSRRAYISYEKDNVRPRQKVTYEKLADVLGCEPGYLLAEDKDSAAAVSGLLTGAGIALLAPLMGVPVSAAAVIGASLLEAAQKSRSLSKAKGKAGQNDEAGRVLKQSGKKQKMFRATALGIIVKALAQKGIRFQMGNAEELEAGTAFPEEYVLVEDQAIDEWWFRFWAFSEVEELMSKCLNFRADSIFSSFCAATPDPNRKASIVVNDERLFDELLHFQSSNSYRGNMSVIMIDVDNARIVREELLSSFNIDDTEDKLSIL